MSRRRRNIVLAVVVLALSILSGVTGSKADPPAQAYRSAVYTAPDQDFADPGIFYDYFSSRWYLYRTGHGQPFGVKSAPAAQGPYGEISPVGPYRSASSTEGPAWVRASDPKYWAPDVFYTNNNGVVQYVMYYSAVYDATGLHCIGIATSTAPTGPFVDAGAGPALCSKQDPAGQKPTHEAIDPSLFVGKNGERYLLYKDNYMNMSDFKIVRVPMDMKTGTKKQNDGAYVDINLPNKGENPSAVIHKGRIWLFLSENDFGTGCQYQTTVWSAEKINTHFQREKVVMTNSAAYGNPCGPGGANVLIKDGTTYIAFAVWENRSHPQDEGVRLTYVGKLGWNDPASNGRPYLAEH